MSGIVPSAGWIPLLSAFMLAFTVLSYVVLDGTDLGVGILFLADRGDEDREVMAESILPIWDGNETWLVLGGGGLLALFPAAYSVFLTAVYLPLIAMLLALIIRGVALEFRDRASKPRRRLWDLAFLGGSVLASFCQGVTLGALVQGIRSSNDAYTGGWWDWLTPFSILCGVALIVGYALLGACWLIWRTEGALQERSRRQAHVLGMATLAFIVAVSIWTPMLGAAYRERWFSWPNILLTSPVPILLAALAGWFWWALSRKRDLSPLIASLGWFVLSYAGIGISLYPMIVPPSLTIGQAGSAPSSQVFVLIGAAVLIPTILAYNSYAFWVFRGKVKANGL